MSDLQLRLLLSAKDQGYTATLQDAEGKTVDFGEKLGQIKTALLGLAGLDLGVGIVRQLVEQADAYSQLSARIKLAVGDTGDYQQAMDDVVAIAERTRSTLDSVASLYEKLSVNARNLGINQQEVANLTELINKGMALSGSTTETVNAAIYQLTQGLGAGAVRGEDFNSVMEASVPLMQAVADGLGMPLGKLRELAEQGKLTSTVFLEALGSQADVLSQKFAALPESVDQAVTKLGNAFQVWIGQANESVGATQILTAGIDFLARNLDALEPILAGLAAGGLAKFGLAIQGQIAAFQANRKAAAEMAQEVINAAKAEADAAASAAIAAQIRTDQAAKAQALAQTTMELAESTLFLEETDTKMLAAQKELNVSTATLQQARQKEITALAAQEAAQAKLAVAQTAATQRTGLLASAMNLLGGPTGVIMLAVTALGFLVAAFSKSDRSMEQSARTIDEYKNKLKELDEARTRFLIQEQQQVLKAAQAEEQAAAQRMRAVQDMIRRYDELGVTMDQVLLVEGEYVESGDRRAALETDLTRLVKEHADATDILRQRQSDLNTAQQRLADLTDQNRQITLAQRLELEKQATAAEAAGKQTESYTKTIQAVMAAETARIGVGTEITRILGNEAAGYQAAASQARRAAEIAQTEAAAKQAQADAAQSYLEKLENQFQALTSLTEEQKKQLDAARENATAQAASAAQSQAAAQAAQLQAAQLAGVAQAHQQVSQSATLSKETLAQLRAEYDRLKEAAASPQQLAQALNALLQAEQQLQQQERATNQERAQSTAQLAQLKQAYLDTTAEMQQLTSAQAQGKATQDQVNAAQLAAIQALNAYKTALEQALTAKQNEIQAAQSHAAIAKQELQVRIDQTNAAIAEAKARNDTVAVTRLEVEAKQLAAQQAAAQTEALKQELTLLQQQLALKQQQVQVDDQVTLAEQAQIQALQDAIAIKQLDIDSSRARVDQLNAEAAATRNATQSQTEYTGQIETTNSAFLDGIERRRQAEADAEAAAQAAAVTIQTAWQGLIPLWDQLTEKTQAEVAQLAQLGIYTENFQARLRQINTQAAQEAALLDRIQGWRAALEQGGLAATQAQAALTQLARESQAWGETASQAGQQAKAALQDYLREIQSATEQLQDMLANQKRDLGDQRAYEAYQHQKKLKEIEELGQTSGENSRLARQAIANENELYRQQLASLEQIRDTKAQSGKLDIATPAQDLARVDLSGLVGSLRTVAELLLTLRDRAGQARVSMEDMAADVARLLNEIARQQRVTV